MEFKEKTNLCDVHLAAKGFLPNTRVDTNLSMFFNKFTIFGEYLLKKNKHYYSYIEDRQLIKYLSQRTFIHRWNCFNFRLESLQTGISSQLLDVVYSEANQEVVDHDRDDNHKDEDDGVDDNILVPKGVFVLKLPYHHSDCPDKGLHLRPELVALDEDEDEGEAEQGGAIQTEEEENFLRNLKIRMVVGAVLYYNVGV